MRLEMLCEQICLILTMRGLGGAKRLEIAPTC